MKITSFPPPSARGRSIANDSGEREQIGADAQARAAPPRQD